MTRACHFTLQQALERAPAVIALQSQIMDCYVIFWPFLKINTTQTDIGHLYSWGCGAGGRLGHNDYCDRWEPCRIEALSHAVVTIFSCGDAHSLASVTEMRPDHQREAEEKAKAEKEASQLARLSRQNSTLNQLQKQRRQRSLSPTSSVSGGGDGSTEPPGYQEDRGDGRKKGFLGSWSYSGDGKKPSKNKSAGGKGALKYGNDEPSVASSVISADEPFFSMDSPVRAIPSDDETKIELDAQTSEGKGVASSKGSARSTGGATRPPGCRARPPA